MELFERISHDVKIMGGKACIKGTRVTVGMILGQLSVGQSVDELLDEYPYLLREDIMAALKYAAWIVSAEEFNIKTIFTDTPNSLDNNVKIALQHFSLRPE